MLQKKREKLAYKNFFFNSGDFFSVTAPVFLFCFVFFFITCTLLIFVITIAQWTISEEYTQGI